MEDGRRTVEVDLDAALLAAMVVTVLIPSSLVSAEQRKVTLEKLAARSGALMKGREKGGAGGKENEGRGRGTAATSNKRSRGGGSGGVLTSSNAATAPEGEGGMGNAKEHVAGGAMKVKMVGPPPLLSYGKPLLTQLLGTFAYMCLSSGVEVVGAETSSNGLGVTTNTALGLPIGIDGNQHLHRYVRDLLKTWRYTEFVRIAFRPPYPPSYAPRS